MTGLQGASDTPKSSSSTFSALSTQERIPTMDGSTLSSVHSEGSKYSSANYRRAAGASYVVAMGVCGIVLVALVSSLKDLARHLDTTSIRLPEVFITRGLGAGLGAIVSSKLYLGIPGKVVVSIALFLLAGTLMCIPLVGDVGMLQLNFAAIGFLTAVINAGSQIMTHRLHGSAAGPWLGANTVAFGVSGAFSPLIGFLTGSLMVEYSILASMTFGIAFFLVVMPEPPRPLRLVIEEHPEVIAVGIPAGLSKPLAFYKQHKVDFHLGGMMFWFMGGRMSATAFFRQFADDTDAVSANSASLLVVLFWLAITLGRLIALRDQQTLDLPRLYRHLLFVGILGAATTFLLLVLYSIDAILWTTVIAYGLFNGPTLGYCYDLSTRVSPDPMLSTAVAMFGLTAGSSIVPVIAAGLWDMTGFAAFLPLVLFVSHVVPSLLVNNLQKLPPAETSRQRRRSFRREDSAVAAATPTFRPASPLSTWPQGSTHGEHEEDDGRLTDVSQREIELSAGGEAEILEGEGRA